jgi:hypothetical protein
MKYLVEFVVYIDARHDIYKLVMEADTEQAIHEKIKNKKILTYLYDTVIIETDKIDDIIEHEDDIIIIITPLDEYIKELEKNYDVILNIKFGNQDFN